MPMVFDWQDRLADRPDKDRLKEIFYQFFEKKLEKGEIYLSQEGPDFDAWRKPIDMAVIHYTGGKPGITWQELSAIGFLRQYAADFCKYDDVYGVSTKGQPIWSGHFRDRRQVFYAYHFLVRMDGTFERLLDDKYIGWHAGNKDVNFRSVGIVLDGEFVDMEPPGEVIEGIVKLLKENYPKIPHENVKGHREVNPNTVCPGNLFLSSWKQKVLQRLETK